MPHQLRATHGAKAGTLMSNAGVLQVFGVDDFTTAGLLSKSIGQAALEYDTAGSSRSASIFEDANHLISITTHVAARHLMTPDEIMRMPASCQLLRIQGRDPLIVEKVRYYDGCEFAGLANPADLSPSEGVQPYRLPGHVEGSSPALTTLLAALVRDPSPTLPDFFLA